MTVHHRHMDVHEDQVVIAFPGGPEFLHGFGAVAGHLHLCPRYRQKLQSNLLIQLIILHEQDMAAAVIPVPVSLTLLLMNTACQLRQRTQKPALEQRTGHEGIDPGTSRTVFRLYPVRLRYEQDREFPSGQLPHMSGKV